MRQRRSGPGIDDAGIVDNAAGERWEVGGEGGQGEEEEAGKKAKKGEVSARPPSLSCRTSPPQGGRFDVMPAFANHRRRRMSDALETANLPP